MLKCPNGRVSSVVTLALALTLVLTLSARSATSTAVREQSWSVAGLKGPADIVVDHWGIAHIFASNTRDAFFLQGFNAARDRLWQIDLWRKRGLGLLSKSLGPAGRMHPGCLMRKYARCPSDRR